MKCNFDPVNSSNTGMFHCPECGEMVIGGVSHLDYEDIDEELYKEGEVNKKILNFSKIKKVLGYSIIGFVILSTAGVFLFMILNLLMSGKGDVLIKLIVAPILIISIPASLLLLGIKLVK